VPVPLKQADFTSEMQNVKYPEDKALTHTRRFYTQSGLLPGALRALAGSGIAAELGVGVGTIYRVVPDGSKIRQKVF
jgi:hypothetical protein